MWSKIGVNTKVYVVDMGKYGRMRNAHNYKDAFLHFTGNVFGVMQLQINGLPGNVNNVSNWNDPSYVEKVLELGKVMNPDERIPLGKELAVQQLEAAAYIPFAVPYQLGTYWPWLKNYYEEVECGQHNYAPILARIWVDESMKKQMGF